MTREEANRQMAEDELKQMREDPRTIAAVAQGTRERAEREAQAEERRQQEEEARRAKARAELERERQRRLNVWLSHGGNEESFAKAWPDMERKILEEKQAALDRKRAEGSIF
jgi:hypothetical protein